MKRFNINRRTLYMVLSIMIIAVVSLSIAYAALSVTLTIVGNTEVQASNWNIYLTNPIVKVGSVNNDVPVITNNVTASFTANLQELGDFYEFTIDIKNDGSLDAMIESINKTTLSFEQAKYLNYIIEYENGEEITTKQLLRANSFVRLKVKVEYRVDLNASDLPSTTEILNLSFIINYVQSSEENDLVEVPDNGVVKPPIEINVIEGDGTQIGDRIQIDEEYFRVLSNQNDEIAMLAEKCINVVTNTQTDSTTSSGCILTKETGYTTMNFSTSNYWNNQGLTYSNSYPFVYNAYGGASDEKHSRLVGYLEAYKNKFVNLGVEVLSARLINWEELKKFGCTTSNILSCTSKYDWTNSGQYWWTGVAYSNTYLLYVEDDYFDSINSTICNGVRPVLIIPSTLI